MNEQIYILKLFQDRLLGLTNLNNAFKPNLVLFLQIRKQLYFYVL